MNDQEIHPASFRDPAGFVFREEGRFLRQVNLQYADAYEKLMQSGLYEELVKRHWLISHESLPQHKGFDGNAYTVLLPKQLDWITYPYEWTFDMLKDAALLTLSVQQCALNYDMILKDASAFNVQFVGGRPIWIDTLSFEPYDFSKPWIAYRQFCQHFLFPLMIGHYKGISAQQWLEIYLDGLPVELTASLLPWFTRFKLGIAMHVHLQNRFRSGKKSAVERQVFSLQKMKQLIDHLRETIIALKWPDKRTPWGDYYESTIISQQYLDEKKNTCVQLLEGLNYQTVIDVGANNGYFSIWLASSGIPVLSVDSDQTAINDLYKTLKVRQGLFIQPLVTDLLRPSAGIGWMNMERQPFIHRFRADLVLGLAIVHHLYFTGDIPMLKIFDLFAQLTNHYLLVEFVSPTDQKVGLLVKDKPHLLAGYHTEAFEQAGTAQFKIIQKKSLINGQRSLYLMEKNV